MLLQLGLLLPALALCGLSLLTCVRVPVIIPWRATVIAGEYGHSFALGAGGWALIIWMLRGEPMGLSVAAILFCGIAIVCFLRPVFSARRVSATLHEQMTKGWSSSGGDSSAFSLRRLWKARPDKVAVETHEYTGGVKLDFRRAVNRDGAAPCVIMIHGGGWDSGDRVEIPFFNDWLAREGYAVASVDYRLAPEHIWPAQRDDVLSAMQWLKSHASEFGIDPKKFVLMGRSAGGQIASATAYTAQDESICGLIALYAPHDMPFAWSVSRPDDALNSVNLMRQYLGGPPDTPEREERYRSASGHLNIAPARQVPTLLMHGLIDTLVWYRHSRRFAASLTEAGQPHVLVELPWAAHAFEYNLSGPAGQLTTYAVRRFLHSVTDDS